MADKQEEIKKQNVQAEDESIAIGSIEVGGDVSGNITIGNVYNYPSEEEVPLSKEEIANGLSRFAEYIPERAPILGEKFSSASKNLRATLGADLNALSPTLRNQHEDALNVIKLMCMEVLDISFQALCQGQNPPPFDSRSPFLGLFAFQPEDKEFFFGREELVQKLIERLKQYPFLAVVGASGSGKSSLVMAGLIPALEAEMKYFTPSFNPLHQLQKAKEKANNKTIFVVDQFEELFTLTQDVDERKQFIKELLALTKTNRVIITMRADFWGDIATYKELRRVMQDHQELIAPMDPDELSAAMEKQAAVVGLRFESTLSEDILDDVKGEPGAMPLLQHALWMLWNRRHGMWLKAEEYRAFGGIQRAIATTADEFYEQCSPENRERFRNIFVRLTRLDGTGQASRDTRRRVTIKELVYKDDTLEQTVDFIRQLANSRLLITSSETFEDQIVEVAHEALIRNWPRLRSWLNEDRLSLLVQEAIREAASNWEASEFNEDAIAHRGGKLEDALHLMRNPRANFSVVERDYLEACQRKEQGFVRALQNRINRWLLPSTIIIVGLVLILSAFVFSPFIAGMGIGFAIPLFIVFIIAKLDQYNFIELKWIIFCLLGGTVGYFCAVLANRTLVNYGIADWDSIVRYIAPILETALKGVILYLLLRRVKFARAVDGIFYGVAVGAGFAIIENFEYISGYPSIALSLAIQRVFSTNLLHMSVTGLSGYLLVTARFDNNRLIKISKIITALTIPSIPNIIYNNLIMTGAFFVIAIVFGLILGVGIRYLVNQDQKWIERYLQRGTAHHGKSSINNVQQIAIAIRNLFGSVRASQVERFLILHARKNILRKSLESLGDPKLEHFIEEQLRSVQRNIRGNQHVIGNYCWENIKAFIPELTAITEGE